MEGPPAVLGAGLAGGREEYPTAEKPALLGQVAKEH